MIGAQRVGVLDTDRGDRDPVDLLEITQINLGKSRVALAEVLKNLKGRSSAIAAQEPPIYKGSVPGLPPTMKCLTGSGLERPRSAIIVTNTSMKHIAHYMQSTDLISVMTVGQGPHSVRLISTYCPPNKPLIPVLGQLEEILSTPTRGARRGAPSTLI